MPQRIRTLISRAYEGHEEGVYRLLRMEGNKIFSGLSDFECAGILTFLEAEGYDCSAIEDCLLEILLARQKTAGTTVESSSPLELTTIDDVIKRFQLYLN
ncbi:MAG: hypothetical protein KKG75_01980 [Nanoarchaeota archaeon]|nr:hypothetical protein [Nanoarchaeota archaeon]